ncbi:uncharacterized protein LOC117178532 [Belonocnema kinseyi]|uniref:uncharacterized protein LOC117178532 n=1 Tax=Belonocnema kinseyi TaxID=2817044 RepID=UPI00143DA466|nr:uncharacterized protein LOC117178532 [Belonocnema kinseyi]
MAEEKLEDYVYLNKMCLSLVGLWPLSDGVPKWRLYLQNVHIFIAYALLWLILLIPDALDLYMVWGNIDAMAENLCVNIHLITAATKFYQMIVKKKTFKAFVGICVGITINIGLDTFCCVAVTHTCAQLNIFQKELLELGKNSKVSQGTIKQIIQKHNHQIKHRDDCIPISSSTTGVWLYALMRSIVQKMVLPWRAEVKPARAELGFLIPRYSCESSDHTDDPLIAWMPNQLDLDAATPSVVASHASVQKIFIPDIHWKFLVVQKAYSQNISFETSTIRKPQKKTLHRITQLLNEIFNNISLCQLIMSCLAICTAGFQLIITLNKNTTDVQGIIFNTSFLIIALFQILLYCWPSNELMIQSLEVGNAAYQSLWTNLPHSSGKEIKLLILRSQRPMHITAGKMYILSLERFIAILKTSMQCLSYLRASYKHNDFHR